MENYSKDCVVGIDIGGTNTKYGIVNRSGKILLSRSIPTKGHLPFSDFLSRSTSEIKQHINNLDSSYECLAVGMGVPDGNFLNGMMHDPPNFSWSNVPIASLFSELFECPVVLTNDANAAAMGEARYGVAQKYDHFIEITLGTGLGSGLYVDGSVVLGHSGHAGEMGHIIVEQGGRQCECGLSGCLEMYVSNKGIMETIKECLIRHPESSLNGIIFGDLNGKHIDDAFDNSDKAAVECYQYTGEMLGKGLATAVSILSPEAFIFYGGFSNAGERLLASTKNSMNKHLMDVFKGTVTLKVSNMKEGTGAILGATALAWDVADDRIKLNY
ncbi:MAG: ROK family protein [Candidatus Marinimicrobia bacterium]|jgi:glucokinase|nr:ROK family protein [Candidatus Neomarinimicrobiota bacterium]MBT6940071.1 ROK family protein [Candidatus Neomarinimicrobiota bacterium]